MILIQDVGKGPERLGQDILTNAGSAKFGARGHAPFKDIPPEAREAY